MTMVPGRVVNGRVEVEGIELPEGAEVTVYYDRENEEYDLTPDQEAELEESIAEIRRGEYVEFADGDEVMRELRRRRGLT